ncbi:MAG TPA: hypothetical protein PK867_26070, partial [Pirellulales bacterium]|nr:hypothetical protein [Pirellulales bacterium]
NRWEIQFPDNDTLKSYARFLDQFGIELGVRHKNEVTYLRNFSAGQPDVYRRPANEEKRLYWNWREGELEDADLDLFKRAGIETEGKTVLHFYPEMMEQRLRLLERDFRGREVSAIKKTRFAVRRQGDEFSFYVVDQEVTASGAP